MKAASEKAIHHDTLAQLCSELASRSQPSVTQTHAEPSHDTPTQLNSALASRSQCSATQTHADPSSLAACIETE